MLRVLQSNDSHDAFMLIIGEQITRPVMEEIQVASDHRKSMLLFCKELPKRQSDAQAVLRRLDIKYDLFANSAELQRKLEIPAKPNAESGMNPNGIPGWIPNTIGA